MSINPQIRNTSLARRLRLHGYRLIKLRLPAMMVVAAVIGAFSGVAGLYLSFYRNIASGPAVVLTATTIFVLAFLFAPRRGIVWNWMR